MLRRTGSWQNFYLTSGASNLLLGRLAELVRPHGDRGSQFAIAQNLDGGAYLPNQAAGNQKFWCYRLSRRESVQHFDIYYRILDAGRIVKASLGNPAAQRHLAALKTGTPRIALARFLSLIAFAGGPAKFRADSAAHAHFAMPRSACRLQI